MSADGANTPRAALDMGLEPEEYARICERLGRAPNHTELGIFAAMWSEHCSYKSSRLQLRRLTSPNGPGAGSGVRVICGPGENAGVVDIGGGLAVAFKMESHNHPSFIEPRQGAATGVGGIMRDVFTMGARPVANLNALFFGAPEHPRSRHLVAGVVEGIGGYGNCVGVPTVGGQVCFDPGYNGNILVNAMCVGLVASDGVFRSAAGPGNPVLYVGARTGRDGICGATMASAGFGAEQRDQRPTVQVGDPFMEKLLLEACLELMAGDAIVAVQDMGAAGLTSSAVEMAGRGGAGMDLDLDLVPCREQAMTAREIMLSESQERMLLVLRPGGVAAAEAVFDKWDLAWAVIGRTTDSRRLVVRRHGAVAADIPLPVLVDHAPVYRRPRSPRRPPVAVPAMAVPAAETQRALLHLLGGPHLASRRWVWEQYDHTVMGDTVQCPGGDAAVVRVHGTRRGLAMSVDATPRYVAANALEGGRQAVAEVWRNLTAVGAQPLALTDCLNFGNPERPEVMGQFADAIEGIAQAAAALEMPVVSGNVSLYNETDGRDIPPAPAVGGVGVLDDIAQMARVGFGAGEAIVLVGESLGHLGCSLYAQEFGGDAGGGEAAGRSPPPVDLDAERRNGDFVRAEIVRGVRWVHDVSDGGLLVALAEMALAADLGAEIALSSGAEGAEGAEHGVLFGEDQGRYLLTCAEDGLAGVLERAERAGVRAVRIGRTGGRSLTVAGHAPISVAELRTAHEGWFPAYMSGPVRERPQESHESGG